MLKAALFSSLWFAVEFHLAVGEVRKVCGESHSFLVFLGSVDFKDLEVHDFLPPPLSGFCVIKAGDPNQSKTFARMVSDSPVCGNRN